MRPVFLMAGLFLLFFQTHGQNLPVADSLLRVYRVNGNSLTDSAKLYLLHKISFNYPDPDKKEQYAEQLISLSKKLNHQKYEYIGTYLKGSAYRKRGELETALKLYFKTSEIAQQMQDYTRQGKSYTAIADVYTNNNDPDNSLRYYNKAISILRTSSGKNSGKDSIALASTLMNTGYKYYLNHRYDTALLYYQESGEIFKRKNYDVGIAYNIGNTGLVYARQNKNTQAEEAINTAMQILGQHKHSYAISEFLIETGGIYQEQGNYQLAQRYVTDALRIAIRDGLKKRIRDASLKLSQIHEANGRYKEAYTNQSRYLSYRDSIINEETIRKLADQRTAYEVGLKQSELDLLEASQAAERRQSLIIGTAMVLVLLLIGLFAYTQYKFSQQRKKVNRQLAAQKLELEKLNKTKDRFFSIISHDLRGPVSAFASVSRLLKMYLKKGKIAEINEMAGEIGQSADRLGNLLDNLLEWAMQQQGQFPYKPEKILLNQLTDDLINTFEMSASGKEISLFHTLKEDIFLWGDKNTVTTIFRNLINNALKFTEKGEVFLSAEETADTVKIYLHDTGVGMPAEKVRDLFKLSDRKSTWGTDGEKGLGLGLQLVYEFVDLNKGTVSVQSTEGVGTVFTIELPRFKQTISQEKIRKTMQPA